MINSSHDLRDLDSPIFVIGNPRSGTTLMRLMLTCHAQIVIPPECGFAVWLYDQYADWCGAPDQAGIDKIVRDILSCRKADTWNFNREQLVSTIEAEQPQKWADIVSLVYVCYGQAQGRSFSRWGDKNNFYLDHVPTIDRMFPRAKYLHIVRDGRDVACSYRRLGQERFHSPYAPQLPFEIAEIARLWLQNINTVRSAFDAIGWDNVIEVRLEDVTEKPVQELTRVCTFLGEQFDPQMLQFHELNHTRQLEPEATLEWKQRTMQPITKDHHGIFHRELGPQQRQCFEDIAGAALKRYGYLDETA